MKTLTQYYPCSVALTCCAHLIHNCALRIRSHFEIIDILIARVKAITKNRSNQQIYQNWTTFSAYYYSVVQLVQCSTLLLEKFTESLRDYRFNWRRRRQLSRKAREALQVPNMQKNLMEVERD